MKTRYLFGLPLVELEINSKEIEPLIDTGFNGSTLLPSYLIQHLKLQKVGNGSDILADGSVGKTELFDVEIKWINSSIKVIIVSVESDVLLIGMELLKHARTTIEPSKDVLTIEKSGRLEI